MLKKNTQILLLVLIVALSGLLIWQILTEKEADSTQELESISASLQETTVIPQPLTGISSSAYVTSVDMDFPEGRVFVERDVSDGLFYLTEPELSKSMTDTEWIEYYVNDLVTTMVNFDLGDTLTPEQTGLDDPGITVTIVTDDGKSHTLLVGDVTSIQNGYYVSFDGSTPKVVSNSPINSFMSLKYELPVKEIPTPEVDTDS